MNQPIRILTPDLEFVGEIDNYESLQFTRRFNKPGEFELHINLNKNLTNTLQEDHFIYVSANKVGIIRHREVNRENSEQLIIRGYTLQGLLNRRVTYPPTGYAYDSITGPLETVMKHYVMNNAISPDDPTRAFSNMVMNPDLGRGETFTWDSRFQQLDTELETMSSETMGWDIHLDLENKLFIFDVVASRDLSAGQELNPPVLFSIDFDNVKNQNFVDSSTGYRNTAYVGGQGEGVDRLVTEVGSNASGFQRLETFIDASDVEDDLELPLKGMEKLKEFRKIQSFESEILTYGPFTYEEHWDVGDIVTVQDRKLGLTLDSPIVSVKEVYEPSGYILEATFGNAVPTLIDKVKQSIDGPMKEKPFVPSKTTDLENDAGYITHEEMAESGYDKAYIHDQISPAEVWSVLHYLQKNPSVTVVDSAGNTVVGDVEYESISKVTITFTTAFAGKAYLN